MSRLFHVTVLFVAIIGAPAAHGDQIECEFRTIQPLLGSGATSVALASKRAEVQSGQGFLTEINLEHAGLRAVARYMAGNGQISLEPTVSGESFGGYSGRWRANVPFTSIPMWGDDDFLYEYSCLLTTDTGEDRFALADLLDAHENPVRRLLNRLETAHTVEERCLLIGQLNAHLFQMAMSADREALKTVRAEAAGSLGLVLGPEATGYCVADPVPPFLNINLSPVPPRDTQALRLKLAEIRAAFEAVRDF